MATFTLPRDIIFNTQKLSSPASFAREHEAASWLYLNGEEFSSMEGGMSYRHVQESVPRSARVASDPPRVLDLELARLHVAALDELPRPTLVTCRAGPRASAVAYMYAGLRAGAEPEQVLLEAERADAPFCRFDDYKKWVRTSIEGLRREARSAKDNRSLNPNQALWEKGDFTRIAESMRVSGEALVQRLGVKQGLEVLDLGCGDGTTAVPLAKAGARVLGVDIARNLVDAGNRRAKDLGLANCKFQHGDACNLHELSDGSFDLVVSVFGAMFAPKPFDVAKEMVRVTRPGGRIVMGNWIPNDPTLVAQLLKISSAYSPPPPEGFVSPMTWGVEANVVERFSAAGIPKEKITCAKQTYVFAVQAPVSALVTSFRTYYGPTMNAFEAADKAGRAAELQKEIDDLFERQNQSGSKAATSIPATFLQVTVER